MVKQKNKKILSREALLEKILNAGEISIEILLGLMLEFFDIAKIMTRSPQSAQKALRKQTPPQNIKIDLKTKMAFYSMLSKLKKENLLQRTKDKKIKITKRGKEYLLQKQNRPLKLTTQYQIDKFEDKEKIILFIFDIPEKERHKRVWIRFYLEKFGFRILQKSVWWGKGGLPKEFIKDLKKYNLLSYVHIFSVKDEGTISSIIKNT